MDCPRAADDAFGPAVHGCHTNNFDFTLLFEQSFFQIAPCALLVIFAPLRAKQLYRQKVKTLQTPFQSAKQVAIAALAAIQLALLIIWSTTLTYRTRTSIPAAVVSFLASAALLILSTLEHSRSIRPSSLINTYMLLSLLLDLPQARTLWIRSAPESLASVFTAGIAVKTVILFLEARSKKRFLAGVYRLSAPESIVNLYNRTLLWWLNGLFFKGYRSIIGFDRLYHISASLSSESVESAFTRQWIAWRGKNTKRPLVWTLAFAFKRSIVGVMVLRLFLSAFTLLQPLLINRVTHLLSQPETEQSTDSGRGLIGAAALIYLGIAVCKAMYQRQLHRLLTQIRGAVISAVHSKALVLPSDKLDDVSTLITADIQRTTRALTEIDAVFATPLEVGAAIFLLERQIGVACIAPIAVVLVITIASFVNSNAAIPMQKAWLTSVTERITYTASILASPKAFKMLGLTNYLTDRIQGLRVLELTNYAEYRKYVTYRNAFAAAPNLLAPPTTLMMFVLINGGSALNPTVAFTTLSLVALLTSPIMWLIYAVPNCFTAIASLDRIQEFLQLEDKSTSHCTAGEERTATLQEPGHAVQLASRTSLGGAGDSPRPMVEIRNGSVAVGKEQTSVLHDASVQLLKGSVSFIIGPVGCGKTVLLKAIIGDIPLSQGHRVGAESLRYGYCAQNPWLPNETVRQIILAESDFDPRWYATVTAACAMNSDIATFPQADDTIVGNKGVSLSGGQRQRLALTRALYAREPVLVVDDVLSGLDASTGQTVFENVFAPGGLCKQHGMTVILATHAVRHLRSADNIVAIGQNGRIMEQGSFEELDLQKGYVHELSIKGTEIQSAEQEETALAVEPTKAVDSLAIAEQDLARRTGDVKVYTHYAKSVGWFLGSIVVGSAIAVGFLETFPSVWVRWWSESEVGGDHERPLGVWIGVSFIIAVLSVVAICTNIWVMLVNSVPRSSARLHEQLLHAVMRAPYSFFVETDSGITLNRFSSDMSIIEGELAGSIMQTVAGAAICLALAALIAAGAQYVGVTIPFLLLVLYALQKFYLRTSRQLRFMELESQAPLLTHCTETLSGVATIRAFGWQTSNHRRCIDLLDKSQRPFYLMLCIQRWLAVVLDLITGAIAVIVVAMAMTLRNTATTGSVGVSLLSIVNFSAQLSHLIQAWTSLETALGAVARCMNFEDTTISEDLALEKQTPPPVWPSKGYLQLTDLNASYTPNGEDVLKEISISVAPGEKVGICGRTGSGKSSLLLTLLRLLDNHNGTVILDGLDLATIPRQTIRERITALPQEALTVPGSLRDNIDPLSTASAEVVGAALSKVGLLEIVEQRGGLETDMKELGLSQGQMQLFAVARALLRKSKLLLVDEMTSSVDAVTEEKMVSVIQEEFADSTVLAIAHRLQTIRNFDKVVVMDKGRIVEVGAPSDLLAKDEGYFKRMWERSGH